MKLKKPILTIILIIILVFTLIFFSLSLISKNIVKKNKMKEIIYSFDFNKYLSEYDTINESVEKFYYPKEVFDYIDNKKIKEIEDIVINNLSNKKDIIIKEEQINSLLMNSVLKHDSINKTDSTVYVEKDISYFSKELSNIINNRLKEIYSILLLPSNYIIMMLLVIISIIIFIFIIINEKFNGIFINSIILFFYSFLLYYLDKSFIKNVLNNNYLQYFNNIKSIKLDLEFTYIICFILSFVLLLIYMVGVVKNFIKYMRLNN